MSRKYKEEELQDTIVLDNAGYICGYVSSLDVKQGTVVLNLYEFEIKNQDTVDGKELTQRLIDSAPRKGILNRQLSTDEFYDWIRSSLNLANKEPINIEHLMRYANFRNIAIHKKTEETKVKVDKGTIEWASIDKITFTDLGKCIILNDSVEAKKRGVVPSDKVEFVSTEKLSGKIVIDSEGKIIGSAAKFMPGYPPGILVHLGELEETKRSENKIQNKAIEKGETVDEITPDLERLVPPDASIDMDQLKRMFEKDREDIKRNENKIQNKAIERKTVKEIAINWDRIAKIGDVIFLKDTLKVLKGGRQLKKLQSTAIELPSSAMLSSPNPFILNKDATQLLT